MKKENVSMKLIPDSEFKGRNSQRFFSLERLTGYSIFFTLIIVSACLLWYILFGYEKYLHSDSATKILLAKTILNSGELLPSTWIYVNGDVWLGLLIYPLIFLLIFIQDSFLAYSLNSLFYIAVTVITLFYYLKQLPVHIHDKALLAIIFFSGVSFFYAGYLYGEIAYIPFLIMFLLLSGDFTKAIMADKRLSIKGMIWRYIVYAFFFVHNPSKHVFFFLLPFIGSLLFVSIYREKTNRESLRLVGLLVLALLTASIVYSYIRIGLINENGAANLFFMEQGKFIANLGRFLSDFLYFLGIQFSTNASLISLESIYSIIVLLFLCFICFYSMKLPVGHDKAQACDATDKGVLFLFNKTLFLCYLVIILFVYLFQTPLAQNVYSIRYFYPVIWCGFICSIIYLSYLKGALKSFLVGVILVWAILGSYLSYVSPKVPQASENTYLNPLVLEIEKLGLKKGYSSYWLSGSVEVKGDSKFQMTSVYPQSFARFYWLTDNKVFDFLSNTPSFYLAPDGEVADFEAIMKKKSFKDPLNVFRQNGMNLYVFDYDLAYHFIEHYPAEFVEGIDFSKPGYPSFVASVKGVSSYEPSHRWSDGDTVEFTFINKLPSTFSLVFMLQPFGPNADKNLSVEIGAIKKRILITSGYKSYSLDFTNVKSDIIRFKIPQASSYMVDGKVIDPRLLGVAFKSIKIVEKLNL